MMSVGDVSSDAGQEIETFICLTVKPWTQIMGALFFFSEGIGERQ